MKFYLLWFLMAIIVSVFITQIHNIDIKKGKYFVELQNNIELIAQKEIELDYQLSVLTEEVKNIKSPIVYSEKPNQVPVVVTSLRDANNNNMKGL